MGERILLYGATRGTGALIAERLLARGYALRILVRDPEHTPAFSGTVEIVQGDLTRPETLVGATRGVEQVVFTAGVTQRPANEALIKAVEYDGVCAALRAAKSDGFGGRFQYMTSLGVHRPSWMGWVLNRVKGNTLVWRRAAEEAIQSSGLPSTIVRAGILVDAPGGSRPVTLSQGDQPLTLGTRIARADVADLFVHLIVRPTRGPNVVEAVWGAGQGMTDWEKALDALTPNTHPVSAQA
jgi:uncharacterized protein YbjT (DUF2867 family)